jgi:hypothetical protein
MRLEPYTESEVMQVLESIEELAEHVLPLRNAEALKIVCERLRTAMPMLYPPKGYTVKMLPSVDKYDCDE